MKTIMSHAVDEIFHTLQGDAALAAAPHARGFAVETDGNGAPPPGLDWIRASPKDSARLLLDRGDGLKLVRPRSGALPERFEGLAFGHLILQPTDGPERAADTQAALGSRMAHPRRRPGSQTHKTPGIA